MLSDSARVRPSLSARTPKTSPPTAEAARVSDASRPPVASVSPRSLIDGRQDQGVEHHVERIQQPAHGGGHKGLPRRRRRFVPERQH